MPLLRAALKKIKEVPQTLSSGDINHHWREVWLRETRRSRGSPQETSPVNLLGPFIEVRFWSYALASSPLTGVPNVVVYHQLALSPSRRFVATFSCIGPLVRSLKSRTRRSAIDFARRKPLFDLFPSSGFAGNERRRPKPTPIRRREGVAARENDVDVERGSQRGSETKDDRGFSYVCKPRVISIIILGTTFRSVSSNRPTGSRL